MEVEGVEILHQYRCRHCLSIYEDIETAQQCSQRPVAAPKYRMLDVVYLRARYPRDIDRPYVRRVIVEIGPLLVHNDGVILGPEHQWTYKLDRPVQVGKSLTVGILRNGWSNPEDDYRGAIEGEMLRIGDPLGDGKYLNQEMICQYS